LLRSYTEDYKLVITSQALRSAETDVVHVHVSIGKDLTWFSFELPEALKQQLTYADLKHAYGLGIETPRPKEPMEFSVMFEMAGARSVPIFADSKHPPSAGIDSIFSINVMFNP